jgi:ribosome-associated translation inhibitor RaiA
MPITTEVSYRGIESSPSVEEFIRTWVERLERVYDRVQRCAVMVEVPHRHHHQGRQFHVRIALAVPGRELAVSRDPGVAGAHDSAYVAIRDAFRAARRQLEDFARIERGDTKLRTTG